MVNTQQKGDIVIANNVCQIVEIGEVSCFVPHGSFNRGFNIANLNEKVYQEITQITNTIHTNELSSIQTT